LAVALGLIRLADEMGLCDLGYIETRTTGWDELRRSVDAWTPEAVTAVSGVTEPEQRQIVRALATGRASVLLTGRGPEQQSRGVDTVVALVDLMLVLGRIGLPASGFGCLTGQANGQGGREHGQKADQLPGYRSISDPADRAAVAMAWGIEPSSLPGPGMSAVDMLESIGSPSGIRGLLVFGSDLSVASPDAGNMTRRLGDLDLLVVVDPFPSSTAELADVVLPAAQWAEEDGTVTNLEGRVIRRRRAVAPPEGVHSDLEILAGLAERLGDGDRFRFPSPEAVFEELRSASRGGRADYSGITYRRLDAESGVFWPCPGEGHPGTPRLFTGGFGHPDGKAHMGALGYRPPAEPPDEAYPVVLTTGRMREHYNSGTQTRRIERLRGARPEPLLQMHPDLAARLGVGPGTGVAVESRRGRATFVVDLTSDIREDTVFVPFHWAGDQRANLLTVAALDPTSRMPEFKVCAVRIVPV
jgi:assimilatory nitrate reductase catalytic subunit